MTMSDVEIIEPQKAEQQEDVQEIDTPRLSQQQQQQPHSRRQQPFQQNQNNKDRTLFCINIDPRCTEDILFELFLQAGPIENIVRKPDRNGNMICLVTYKHLESVDYSVKLFDKILLFGQKLSVKQSQATNVPAQAPLTPSTSAPNTNNSPSGYQKPYSRTQSYEHRQSSNNHHQAPAMLPQQPPMIPPQLMAQMGQMGMPFNLFDFMAQPLLPFNNNNNNNNTPQYHHNSRHSNQSPSPNNHHRHHQHHSRRDNQSRGHHHQQHQHDGNYNRSRDNRYNNEHDKRSRSPFDRNRRQ